MKPAEVSDKDWEEALVIDTSPDSMGIRTTEPVHIFLQRGETPGYIFLLENGCLVRGKYMRTDDENIKSYIERNKDRYLGIGYSHKK